MQGMYTKFLSNAFEDMENGLMEVQKSCNKHIAAIENENKREYTRREKALKEQYSKLVMVSKQQINQIHELQRINKNLQELHKKQQQKSKRVI